MEVNDKAMELLADLGYDPQFGARPLKRVIQKELVNELSKLVLSGKLSDGDKVLIGTDNIGFTFEVIEVQIDGKEEKTAQAPDELKEEKIAKSA